MPNLIKEHEEIFWKYRYNSALTPNAESDTALVAVNKKLERAM